MIYNYIPSEFFIFVILVAEHAPKYPCIPNLKHVLYRRLASRYSKICTTTNTEFSTTLPLGSWVNGGNCTGADLPAINTGLWQSGCLLSFLKLCVVAGMGSYLLGGKMLVRPVFTRAFITQ